MNIDALVFIFMQFRASLFKLNNFLEHWLNRK